MEQKEVKTYRSLEPTATSTGVLDGLKATEGGTCTYVKTYLTLQVTRYKDLRLQTLVSPASLDGLASETSSSACLH